MELVPLPQNLLGRLQLLHVVDALRVLPDFACGKARGPFDPANSSAGVGHHVDLCGPSPVELDEVVIVSLAFSADLWWGVLIDDTVAQPLCPILDGDENLFAVVCPLVHPVGLYFATAMPASNACHLILASPFDMATSMTLSSRHRLLLADWASYYR